MNDQEARGGGRAAAHCRESEELLGFVARRVSRGVVRRGEGSDELISSTVSRAHV